MLYDAAKQQSEARCFNRFGISERDSTGNSEENENGAGGVNSSQGAETAETPFHTFAKVFLGGT
ncbi:MAG: hypothetical protein ACRD2P_18225 [Terriglobia bacterium]